MRHPLFVLLFWLPWSLAWAQADSVEQRFAATITEADLRARLNVLANDSMEGRETGMEGQRKASAYIVEQFRSFGIPPVPGAEDRGMLADGYRQRFPLTMERLGGLSIAVAGKPFSFLQDFIYFSETLPGPLDADEVMVLAPVSLGGTRLGGSSKVVMLLDPQDPGTDVLDQVGQARATLAQTGAQVLLVVQDSLHRLISHYSPLLTRTRMQLGGAVPIAKSTGPQVVIISPAMAQAILDQGHLSVEKAYKTAVKKRLIVDVPMRFDLASRSMQLSSENVLGYVEGSDRKDEVVAVTAHYDHIGIIDGEVYNGADDDGSGTAAVLEMAQAFAQAKASGHGPRRSLLFMTVSGEEKGLLGSEWYTDHPVFPLDSTVADLNIDMIGRTDTVYGDSSHYVYVIGSKRISTELGELIEQENATWTQLHLDYTFDADSDPNRFYYRSDHYNFAKHGVPIAFFFNGVHADYHGPHDEVDKIRFDLLRTRTLLVFHTAWQLANREARIAVDHPVPKQR